MWPQVLSFPHLFSHILNYFAINIYNDFLKIDLQAINMKKHYFCSHNSLKIYYIWVCFNTHLFWKFTRSYSILCITKHCYSFQLPNKSIITMAGFLLEWFEQLKFMSIYFCKELIHYMSSILNTECVTGSPWQYRQVWFIYKGRVTIR